MTATTLQNMIEQDHKYTLELVGKLQSEFDSNMKNKYKNSLVRHLSRALTAEEMVLYPIIDKVITNKKLQANKQVLLETLKEAHLKIKEDLVDMDSMVSIQVDFGKKLEQMMVLLNTVYTKEMDLMTELSNPALTDESGSNLIIDDSFGKEYLSAKESAPTRPHPKQPMSNPIVQAAACAVENPIDKLKDVQREFAD